MAVSEFRRGVESSQRQNDKNNEMLARINLGRILVVQRKYDEAIDEYKEAEKLSMKVYKQDFNPDSFLANYLAGIALVYKGDYRAAQDRADAIQSIMQKGIYNPMNLDFYHLLLWEIYTAQKNPKAAQREINKLSGWAKEASPRYKKLIAAINEIQGDHSLLEPLQINSTVSVYTPLQQLKVILQNRWKSIGLPIGQPPQIILENGEFDVEGDLSSVAYRLNSNAKSQHLPSLAVVKLNGTANQELISIAELQINSNEGAITANGNVNLKPDLKASLSIQGKQFNPKFFVAEMPGKLDFNADVIASLIEHEVMAAIDLKSLTGKLRDYDINGFGKIHYSPDSVQAEKFNLIIGENTIKVNGKFGVDDNQADFKLVANNLTQLHPKFSGQIQGEGSFKGAIKSPHIRTTLKGENIKFNDQVSVATISIDGDVYVFGDKSSNVRIQASNITLKENIIDTVDLVATGSQKNHHKYHTTYWNRRDHRELRFGF